MGHPPQYVLCSVLEHARHCIKMYEYFHVFSLSLGRNTVCLCVFKGRLGILCHALSLEELAPKVVSVLVKFGLE